MLVTYMMGLLTCWTQNTLLLLTRRLLLKDRKNQNATKTRNKEAQETFGGDRYVYYPDCGDGYTGVCMSKLKLYTLNMCRFLYINERTEKGGKRKKGRIEKKENRKKREDRGRQRNN